MANKFNVGDKVEKYTGQYTLAGEVRAVFTVVDGGDYSYVVRHEATTGVFCHVYTEDQLRAV